MYLIRCYSNNYVTLYKHSQIPNAYWHIYTSMNWLPTYTAQLVIVLCRLILAGIHVMHVHICMYMYTSWWRSVTDYRVSIPSYMDEYITYACATKRKVNTRDVCMLAPDFNRLNFLNSMYSIVLCTGSLMHILPENVISWISRDSRHS